jgi:hypothetical protein
MPMRPVPRRLFGPCVKTLCWRTWEKQRCAVKWTSVCISAKAPRLTATNPSRRARPMRNAECGTRSASGASNCPAFVLSPGRRRLRAADRARKVGGRCRLWASSGGGRVCGGLFEIGGKRGLTWAWCIAGEDVAASICKPAESRGSSVERQRGRESHDCVVANEVVDSVLLYPAFGFGGFGFEFGDGFDRVTGRNDFGFAASNSWVALAVRVRVRLVSRSNRAERAVRAVVSRSSNSTLRSGMANLALTVGS